jgi:hypothetical protein
METRFEPGRGDRMTLGVLLVLWRALWRGPGLGDSDRDLAPGTGMLLVECIDPDNDTSSDFFLTNLRGDDTDAEDGTDEAERRGEKLCGMGLPLGPPAPTML